MQLQELRIGNYLKNDGVIVKIDARSIFDIWDDKGLKNYEPIPITEEWLLKFGFVKYSTGFWFWRNSIYSIEKEGSWWQVYYSSNDRMVRIKHAHQLQNLYYCLVGKELSLKNG